MSRQYKECFFKTPAEINIETELNVYVVVQTKMLRFSCGMFVDTPWVGLEFLTEDGEVISMADILWFAEIKERDSDE